MFGNLILWPTGISQTQVIFEIVPDVLDTPEWAERDELFNQIATI
jgi:hypothetical protein